MSTPPERNPKSAASPRVPPPTAAAAPTPAPQQGGTEPYPGPPPTTATGAVIQVPGYQILRELGRGGMGVVYLANNVKLDRREVLKVVNKALLEKPGVGERFLREMRLAAKLDHVNVVKAFSAPEAGELFVFAMEYVEGEDLAKLVQRQGPLSIPYACLYAMQTATGLQHAHEQKLVHRDIKPHNLIVTRQGKKHLVKILDFGLAKAKREGEAVTELTVEGAMMGTPAYMAPEQANDAASADIRADIYSLGCTLYFLLTGAPPFTGNSAFAILYAHVTTTPAPLRQRRADAPAALEAIVAKMMARDPARRYQHPIEAARALAPFLKVAPTTAAATPIPIPPPMPHRLPPAPTRIDPPAAAPSSLRPVPLRAAVMPASQRPSPGTRFALLGGLVGLILLLAAGAVVGVVLLFPRSTTPPDTGSDDAGPPATTSGTGGLFQDAATRMTMVNDLKLLAIATHSYHDVNGYLPQAATYDQSGRPLLSWRVALLPYFEHADLYNQFHLDEPWDSPDNIKLLERMPKEFAPPNSEAFKRHESIYQGLVGKGTVFEGKDTKLTMAMITALNGTSNTILHVAAAKSVPWTKPDDVPFDDGPLLPKLAVMNNSVFVSFCDGSVSLLRPNANNEQALHLAAQYTNTAPFTLDGK